MTGLELAALKVELAAIRAQFEEAMGKIVKLENTKLRLQILNPDGTLYQEQVRNLGEPLQIMLLPVK